jgi:hypothetical protein
MQNERPGRTIQTTALVHEAYLKLIDVTNVTGSTGPTSSRYRRPLCGAFCWTGRGGACRRSEAGQRHG